MDKIIAAWDALVRLVRPDVDAIISTFLKAQAKLETFIDLQVAALAKEAEAEAAILAARLRRNTAIDRAYRVIHSLDGITR